MGRRSGFLLPRSTSDRRSSAAPSLIDDPSQLLTVASERSVPGIRAVAALLQAAAFRWTFAGVAQTRKSLAVKRKILVAFWKVLNPLTRRLAGSAPWWVLVETRGRRTGVARVTPLAAGPIDAEGMWLIAVHGRASWIQNLEKSPSVRVRHRGRWRTAMAEVCPWDPAVAKQFNPYARSGPVLTGIDPVLVRLRFS